MIIFICVCYYCLAIIGCFFRYYFSKFTREDFIYNKSLKGKRICCIIYYYFVLAYTAFIYILIKEGMIKSIVILISTTLILVLYVIFVTFLEDVLDDLSSRKKKRK